jgi:hypothetical protein
LSAPGWGIEHMFPVGGSARQMRRSSAWRMGGARTPAGSGCGIDLPAFRNTF